MSFWTGSNMIKTAVELLVAMCPATTPIPTKTNQNEVAATATAPRAAIVVIECCACSQDECCAPIAAAAPAPRTGIQVFDCCPCGQDECCQPPAATLAPSPSSLVIESCQCDQDECCQSVPRAETQVFECCCPCGDDENSLFGRDTARIAVCFWPTMAVDTKCNLPMITRAQTSDDEETSEDEDEVNEIVAALCDDEEGDEEDELVIVEAFGPFVDVHMEMAASIFMSPTDAAHRALASLQQRAIECAIAVAVHTVKCGAWFAALWIKEYIQLTLKMKLEKVRQAVAAELKDSKPVWRWW